MKARRTKHFTDVTAAAHGAFLDFGQISCPTECDRSAPRQCGYVLRLENHDPSHTAVSNLVEWEYVDAVDGTLWWEVYSGSAPMWKSEPLPK